MNFKKIFSWRSIFKFTSPSFQKPSRAQWKQLFKVFGPKEKILFLIFLILFVSSGIFLGITFYFQNTHIRPQVGGEYVEGIVGQPRLINPVYAPTSDVDRDLCELLFSGLMKYDSQGELTKDLAKQYKIKQGGQVYEFYLKKGIPWSDGEELTAQDVIFTVKAIQDPDYQSPLRAEWAGVKTEKISKLGVRFVLDKPSSAFLPNTTLKILPHHIWGEISPEKFPLTFYNLRPVSSGPYKFKKIEKDKSGFIKSIVLARNKNYFHSPPFIEQIKFIFYNSPKDLLQGYKQGEIDGFSLPPTQNIPSFASNLSLYTPTFPRYFALFFNLKDSEILSQKEIRKALNLGTNKKEIVGEILHGQGDIVNSPLLGEILGFGSSSKTYSFDLDEAKKILKDQGFKDTNQDGFREKTILQEPAFQFTSTLSVGDQGEQVTQLQKCLAKDSQIYPQGTVSGYFGPKTKAAVIRFQEKYAQDILDPWDLTKGTGKVGSTTQEKLNEVCFPPPSKVQPLQFSLVTVDQTQLTEVAQMLQNQWKKLGVRLEINAVDVSTLKQEFIKPRSYQSLLFGQVLKSPPDPFPYWHSSQKEDPGLNLSLYENEKADELMKKTRETMEKDKRIKYYQELQDILASDLPAIFLYSPDYLYLVNKRVKGINTKMIVDPSKRFASIGEWFIQTKRVWK